MHSVLHACGDEALRNDDDGQGVRVGERKKKRDEIEMSIFGVVLTQGARADCRVARRGGGGCGSEGVLTG